MFRQDVPEIADFDLGGSCTFGTDGCAVACVFHVTEQEIPVLFTPEKAKLRIYRMGQLNYIDNEFTIQGHLGWKGCFEVLGLDVEVRYEKDTRYICKDNEREILRLEKPGYAHYVPGDGSGHYSWDSLGVRPQQKDYRIAEKRIITIKGKIK